MVRPRNSQDSADPFYEETHTLNGSSESQENATRLMDDLELLRAERIASNQEKDEAGRPRSKSVNRRHKPEAQPEDAFDALTKAPQIPQTKPAAKPTLVNKLFKEIKRFPRIIRYFVYVSSPSLLRVVALWRCSSFSTNPSQTNAHCIVPMYLLLLC